MNSIHLMGRFTAQPEIREANDNKYVKFCLAVDRRSKDKKTDFIDCIAWNKTAEIISKYFSKGSQILVAGNLETSTYERDGKNVKSYSVRVNEVYFTSTSSSKEEGKSSDDEGDSISMPFEV